MCIAGVWLLCTLAGCAALLEVCADTSVYDTGVVWLQGEAWARQAGVMRALAHAGAAAKPQDPSGSQGYDKQLTAFACKPDTSDQSEPTPAAPAAVQHEPATSAPAGQAAPPLLQLPDGVLSHHVCLHLSPWSRLQLRSTCKRLRDVANSVLQASPHITIKLGRNGPYARQYRSRRNVDKSWAVNQKGVQAAAQLLSSTPCTNRLSIFMPGWCKSRKPGNIGALVWPPPLEQVTDVEVEFGAGDGNKTKPLSQLLASVSQACPRLQELSIRSGDESLGRFWTRALAALPPSLRTIDISCSSADAHHVLAALAAVAAQLTHLRWLSVDAPEQRLAEGEEPAADPDASLLAPVAQQLEHLRLAGFWDNAPALMAACGTTLTSLSLYRPSPDYHHLQPSPLLHALLQHTPKLQSLELGGDWYLRGTPHALAPLQHLTSLRLGCQEAVLLLATPLRPTVVCSCSSCGLSTSSL